MAGDVAMAAAFGAGVVAELALLTRRHWTRKRVLGSLALGAVGYVAAFGEMGDAPMVALFFGTLVLVGATAMVFRDHLLPRVSERALLIYTPLYWFLWAVGTTPGGWAWWGLLALGAPPTLATAYLALTRRAPAFRWRVAAYVWFLILLVTVGAFQFSFGTLRVFFGGAPATLGPWEVALAGAAFAYLAAHATYLYWLVRPPGRGESLTEYKEGWRAHVDLLGRRFTDHQADPRRFAAALAAGVALLWANHALGVVPEALLVSAWVLAGVELAGARAGRADAGAQSL